MGWVWGVAIFFVHPIADERTWEQRWQFGDFVNKFSNFLIIAAIFINILQQGGVLVFLK